MSNPKVPTPATLALHGKVINSFNQKLVVELPWLDYAFGKCQVMTKKSGKSVIIYPGIYAGENIEGEYISALPSDEIGNSSFFVIRDPVNIETQTGNVSGMIKSNFGLIFWFDLQKVLASGLEYRNTDLIIDAIIKAIRKSNQGWAGEIKVTGYELEAKNIYREFSYREIKEQFLMHPYFGIRFNGEMKFHETC